MTDKTNAELLKEATAKLEKVSSEYSKTAESALAEKWGIATSQSAASTRLRLLVARMNRSSRAMSHNAWRSLRRAGYLY